MPGEYLPPVITILDGDISPLVAKIEEAKALIASLGDTTIPIKFDIDTRSLARARTYARQLAATFAGGKIPLDFEVQAASAARAAAEVRAVTAATTTGAAGWTIWGIRGLTALHWIVAGGAEILAVAVPALIALGAYAAVAVQGFTNLYVHMQALYTVNEAAGSMFHKTAGQVLGLGDSIQQMQNKVNLQVYQLLGAALNGAQNHLANFAQMGQQVSLMLDRFAAKVDVELRGSLGQTLTSLIANSVRDLQMFGQVLGNIGHSILNIASAMPGLAEILLGGLAGITNLIRWLTDLNNQFKLLGVTPLTAIMGLEEFNRWGGVITGMLGRLGAVNNQVTGSYIGFGRAGGTALNLLRAFPAIAGKATYGIGTLLGKVGSSEGAFARAGAAVKQYGANMTYALQSMSPAKALGLVALGVAVGVLVYKFMTAKSAAQLFAQSLQQALQAASNFQVPQQLASNLDRLTTAQKQAADSAVNFHFSWSGLLHTITTGQNQFVTAGNSVKELGSSLNQTRQEQFQFAQGAAAIERQYHVNYPQALAIAQGANVNLATSMIRLGKDSNIAGQMIMNYVRGMAGMGATTGVLGKDLEAVAIQTGLTNSKVQTLNSSLDQFMQTVTGGTNDLSQFSTALSGMGKSTPATSASITGAISSISRAAQNNTYTLRGWSTNAQQSWQQFDGVLSGSAQQLTDWFRTAGTEGMMSSRQFTTAIKDMVAQLLPFTQGNKTAVAELSALAQQANGPSTSSLKTLAQWVGNTGNAGKNLRSIIDALTQRMANMSKVAQNLGAVMSNVADTAIANATLKASGYDTALQHLASVEVHEPHNQQAIQQAQNQVNQAWQRGYGAAQRMAQGNYNLGKSALTAAGQINTATQAARNLAAVLNSLNGKTITVGIQEVISSQSLHALAAGGAAGGHPYGMTNVKADSGGWLSPGFTLVHNATRYPEKILSPNESGTSGGGGTHHYHVHVDGRELFSWMQDSMYEYDVNNGNRNSLGSASGRLAPR